MDGKLFAPSHTERIFEPSRLKDLYQQAVPDIRKLRRRLNFNAIAVTGNSGCLLGTLISQKLDLPILVVRKKNDDCHDDLKVNGFLPTDCKYLIIDDLIASGSTIRHILRSVHELVANENVQQQAIAVSRATYGWGGDALSGATVILPNPQAVGIYLYDEGRDDAWEFDSRISKLWLEKEDPEPLKAPWDVAIPVYNNKSFTKALQTKTFGQVDSYVDGNY